MMYTELRRNVVMTVYESWKSTGFAWEQYNPETGAGQRTRHFTGWTALIVKIMAMPDLSTESRSTQQDDRFILPPQAHQSSWSLQVLFVIACFGVVSIFRKKITGRFWTQFHSMYIRIHP
jgi:mannosyl-oligosaccharide glucosidase